MSEYFRILNRVENEEPDVEQESGGKKLTRATRSATQSKRIPAAAKAPPTKAAVPARETADTTISNQEARATPKQVAVASSAGVTQNPFAQIFDSLRAGAHEHRLASVVVAPASGASTILEVSQGVAAEAHRHSLQVAIAELVENSGELELRESTRLVTHPNTGRGNDDGIRSVSFALAGGPVPDALSQWLQQSSEDNDLIIIEGPSLDASIDAALVAKACDGLVIVVEPNVTTFEDLTAAVGRARQVGCTVLGLVMNGTEDLPTWVRHIIA